MIIEHHVSAAQVGDYSLASVLITSPIWAPWLSDVNTVLTFVGLALGVVLAARRVIRDFKKPLDEE